ncbi:MAG: pyridoxal-phosphate dependent enzyme [Thermoanaerobaculia bacterium]
MSPFSVFDATILPYPERPGTTVVAEFALPTGSFKDRGAAAVVAGALSSGARAVTLDSSGNAGLAVAAAAARAGLVSRIRVPASISPAKADLLRSTGAVLETHPSRADAVRACLEDSDSYDASHVRNPLFREGVATLAAAWLEKASIPATIYLPVGNGSLLLGLWAGLRALHRAGRIAVLPRLIAVQSERCAPIALPDSPGDGKTIADGCAILEPPAGEEIRRAIAESGGKAIAVAEEEIRRSWTAAWRGGLPIEPTSALAFAGLARSDDSGTAAVIATGSGLKCHPGSPSSLEKGP